MGLWGGGVKVRETGPTDAVVVRELVERALGSTEGRVVNTVVSELDARGLLQGSFVAAFEEDGEERVVGAAGLSRAWVDAHRELVEVLLVSPLVVLPEYRERGVGEALLKASVSCGDELGAPMLVLQGSSDYFRTRGWHEAIEHGVTPPSVRVPSSACRVRLLRTHEKWMTGQLICPDPWWAHDIVGLRDPQLTEFDASKQS